VATDWHLVHLGARCRGGAVVGHRRGNRGGPLRGASRRATRASGRTNTSSRWPASTCFVKSQGRRAGIQLAHAGRKASAARPWDGSAHLANNAGGWPTMAPSALAYGGTLDKVCRRR